MEILKLQETLRAKAEACRSMSPPPTRLPAKKKKHEKLEAHLHSLEHLKESDLSLDEVLAVLSWQLFIGSPVLGVLS
jgi:hypothetical protein